jgi:cytosine/adenosine deaminase-related metal-dependent hydrolase
MTTPPVLYATILLLAVLLKVLPFATHGAPEAANLQNRADLILYNGEVFTADTNNPFVEAVAIRESRIGAVGSSEEVGRWAGPNTRQIDLGGRVAIPGINDSHVHLGYSAPIGGFIPDDPANWMQGPEPQQAQRERCTWGSVEFLKIAGHANRAVRPGDSVAAAAP